MISFSDFIVKQSKVLLENKHHAIFFAMLFAVLPFASWLSVALVALVTLRKGAKLGSDLLLPALVIHTVPLLTVVPIESAIINTLITYIPCYVAAISLRKTMNWQIVCGILFLLAFFVAMVTQSLFPGFIIAQFDQFKTLLSHYHDYQIMVKTASNEGLSNYEWAQLFFGIQILSAVIITICSLLFARAMQAKLFIPGGLANELLAFRSGRQALVILLSISLGAYYDLSVALNVLPLIISYFLITGFGLVFFIFARRRQFTVAVLLLLLIMLKPSFVLFAYVIIGVLDSIFNFRLYLPERVREST
ncbi:MAG: hypothetical protein H0U75_10205 [Legionella sp.]|nr:hypothetical protein [Legionella sp.]